LIGMPGGRSMELLRGAMDTESKRTAGEEQSNESTGYGDALSSQDAASADSMSSDWRSHVPGGAYELKFLVDEPTAARVVAWAKSNLQPDPHASVDVADGYLVNSLYLDTTAFDIYHRRDGFKRRKYRIRRYGREGTVWLEMKEKRNGRVYKKRVPATDSTLSSLLETPDADWEGEWFQAATTSLPLRPICQVTYVRRAWIGSSADGPIRLTLDSHLGCSAANGWQVPDRPLPDAALLGGRQILELKFRNEIPSPYRTLIQDLQLTLGSFSKYRSSVPVSVPNLLTTPPAGPEQTDA
jgi:hypothetical protein